MGDSFHRMYSPPEPPVERPPRASRGGRALAGVAAGVALAGAGAVVALVVGGDSGPGTRPSPARERAAGTAQEPRPAVTSTFRPTGTRIDDADTDPDRLTVDEVFPKGQFKVAGQRFTVDKTSDTSHCDWTARGTLAEALTRAGCRQVVRGTFVDSEDRYAITAGVAALPDFSAAQAALRAGEPGGRAWFRGMRGRTAENIDEAEGLAAYAVRGRYIVYAFTTYEDGRRPDSGLTSLGAGFVAYTGRAIDERARS